MRKKVNFEILFKTLAKKHIEKKIQKELQMMGVSTSPTKSGKFTRITQFTIEKIKPN